MTAQRHTTNTFTKVAAVVLIALSLGALIQNHIIVGVDWRDVMSKIRFDDPYANNALVGTDMRFYGVPWTILALPHAYLPMLYGNALNFILNLIVPAIVVHRLKGGRRALALVFTSPFYLQLLASNNIDWIPLLAYISPDAIAPVLFAIKPQSLAASLLIRAKRAWKTHGVGGLLILGGPLAAVLTASTVVWPLWWTKIGVPPYDTPVNLAPFPLFVPLGLWMLWRAWKVDDMALAGCATPFLVPYVTPYSATANLTVLACEHPRIAVAVWLMAWYMAAVQARLSWL